MSFFNTMLITPFKDSSTREMVFHVPEIVSWVSKFFTLLPGNKAGTVPSNTAQVTTVHCKSCCKYFCTVLSNRGKWAVPNRLDRYAEFV